MGSPKFHFRILLKFQQVIFRRSKEENPIRFCHWYCYRGKTLRAGILLRVTPQTPWILQSLAIPVLSEGDDRRIVLLLEPLAETKLWLLPAWVPGGLQRAAGSPFPARGCSTLHASIVCWLDTSSRDSQISHCFRMASLRAGRSTGNKKWNGRFCQAFAVAKQRADNRNLCGLFNRMNDQVVCNKRKLSDLGEMIKYSTKHYGPVIYLICMVPAIVRAQSQAGMRPAVLYCPFSWRSVHSI